MEFEACLRGRRSVRRYLERPVTPELVDHVLAAAPWAPSPHNAQPWRFAVVRERESRRRLAETMGERWRSDLARDGLSPVEVAAHVGKSRERLLGAPVVIVACLTLRGLDIYPDARRQGAERTMAVQAVGAALQNLLLAAHNAGLATSWMCAPLFCPDLLREVLELPADWEPQAMITMGYASQEKVPPPRRPLSEVVLYR